MIFLSRNNTTNSGKRKLIVRRTIVGALLCFPLQLFAATYYVDSANGDDGNTGETTATAIRSVERVNALSLAPGDAVLFRRNQSFDGVLDIGANGASSLPIQFGAWESGENPTLYEIRITGDHLVLQDITVDHRKDPSDAIRLRGARFCILRNMLIRNGTRDAIDIDKGDGLLVEDVEIHHFLNGSFGSKDDSHGVAITDTDGITIRRANIHHVSGDSLQADPNRTPGGIADNIVIEDSVLWTGPLLQDFNAGWLAGNSPGENAIDTKVLQSGFANEIRMNITLRNVTAYGWTAVPEISNRAVFNLKEKITAELDRITVYNSEIAFRIRGALGNANTRISNAVIFDVGTAVRAEDDVADLRIYNSTFGNGIGSQLTHAGGNNGVPSWDWKNNAFSGSKPGEANHSTNIVASDVDFVDAGDRNYRLTMTSNLVGVGEEIAGVTVDRDGNTRSSPYDVGAFELQGSGTRPMPPVLRVEQ